MQSEPIWYKEWVIFKDGKNRLKDDAPDWIKEEYELFNRDINDFSYLEISDEEREAVLAEALGEK